MSGECERCFEHTLDCVCKMRGKNMLISNKLFDDEMRELKEEKKRYQKIGCKDCKVFLLILFTFMFLFACDKLSAESYIRYDGQQELAHDSRRIYYISGLKNIELLTNKVNEKVEDYNIRKILHKCIKHHSLKFDYNGHMNGLIAAIFADDFLSIYARKVDIDDNYELFDKILNTAIYCFRIDDEREKRPTHSYIGDEVVDWSYLNLEDEENK